MKEGRKEDDGRKGDWYEYTPVDSSSRLFVVSKQVDKQAKQQDQLS